jgi:hypothetical protein
MAAPSTPSNVYVQQGNGQVAVTWDLTAGATTYIVQRSTDGINYTTVSSAALNQFVDTTVLLSVQYYYQVAAQNLAGTSPYSIPQTIIPPPTGEMSLGQIRLLAQQRADRVNSTFVTLPEWNSMINQALFELYDLLITCYEDYFKAPAASFVATGNKYIYPLPDGVLTFIDGNNNNEPFVAAPFYKLLGVDLALNNANNAYVTVQKYNYIDRNRFVYPNTASTIYGVFNLRYRILDKNIELIPTPSAGQTLRLQYIPRMPQLLLDTDTTTMGTSGWIEYAIVRAAFLALTKEESDTSSLVLQLQALQKRIEESAVNRDAGQPDTISDVRAGQYGMNDFTSGYNGGGF